MRNKILFLTLIFFYCIPLSAENIFIQSKNVSLNKKNQTTIFKDEVIVKTEEGISIKSDYAEYDKEKAFLLLKDNIKAIDNKNNIIETNYAEYDEKTKIFKSRGSTTILTSEKYLIEGEDIIFDNSKDFIMSNKKTSIKDQENNKIFLENFEYQAENNIFKSVGLARVEDKMNNSYEFSQIYIDTKKKEILGTDIKAYMNHQDFKINKKNKPRIFANSVKLDKNINYFNKGIFTLCDYRPNDKCPAWSIQSSKILHDKRKKTIYYDNSVLKIYDIPILYLPKLSHPDPTVSRRSGFLPPSFSDTKNLGFGISIPYFFALNEDKNFTLTSRFYNSENPLFIGAYHQAFEKSNLLADFGYTEGYKNVNSSKRGGDKSHFFSKFTKNFEGKNKSQNSLSLSFQDVSNDKYLKLYKIKSDLVDYNKDTLESSIEFTSERDDMFLGFNATVFETLKEDYNDKYEYILPEMTIDKNLFSKDDIGILELQTNLKGHNYDTNKYSNFLINDFNFQSRDFNFNNGLKSTILANIKNINYETKNIDLYKKDPTSEIYGALGLLTEIKFKKEEKGLTHFLTPKLLLRLSPGSMRKEYSGSRLDPNSAFGLSRLDNINNYETGYTGTLGLDYKVKRDNKEFDFSLAQIFNKEENKKMFSKTSLDEKVSDLVGSANYSINDKIKLNYNFSLDQNYNDMNYNELGATFSYDSFEASFDFLQEKKHIGDQEYYKTKFKYYNNSGVFSFENKKNLITNSSEYYDLSYEYLNDCLRAGIVYRREFYNDSEIEPENSLMFKITISPFGDINSPSFN